MPELSVVMPVYNEASVIEGVVAELKRDICDHFGGAEIVMVNDGSTDDTAAILDRLAAEDSRIKVHHAAQNRGHGPTLRQAFDESTGEWILQIDSDVQQVPAEFWQLWERRDDGDLVMGMRRIRRNGRHRVIVSAAARYMKYDARGREHPRRERTLQARASARLGGRRAVPASRAGSPLTPGGGGRGDPGLADPTGEHHPPSASPRAVHRES
jgi:glycosyltransferase involved in cell wall biosynthesis